MAVGVLSSPGAVAMDPPPKPRVNEPDAEGPDDQASKADEFVERIRSLAEPRRGGFGELKVDNERQHIDIWWHGQIDQDVTQLIAEARRSSVTVTEHQAARSSAEMDRLAVKLHESARLKNAGIDIRYTYRPLDQSGFYVGFLSSDPDKGRAAARARELGATETGMPIISARHSRGFRDATLKLDPASLPSLPRTSHDYPDRQDDSPPWYGGAMIISSASEICSTGFSVTRTSGTNVDRMLSALHCNEDVASPMGPYSWRDGANVEEFTRASQATNRINNYDSVMFDPYIDLENMADTDPYIYVGDYNSQSSQVVRRSITSSQGQGARSGGANSGMHVLEVLRTGFTFDCYFYTCINGVIAIAEAGQIAATEGDSGGPVYSHYPGTTDGVDARGIISVLLTEYENDSGQIVNYEVQDCPDAEIRYDGGACSRAVVYLPLWRIIARYGDTDIAKPIELKRVAP